MRRLRFMASPTEATALAFCAMFFPEWRATVKWSRQTRPGLIILVELIQ